VCCWWFWQRVYLIWAFKETTIYEVCASQLISEGAFFCLFSLRVPILITLLHFAGQAASAGGQTSFVFMPFRGASGHSTGLTHLPSNKWSQPLESSQLPLPPRASWSKCLRPLTALSALSSRSSRCRHRVKAARTSPRRSLRSLKSPVCCSASLAVRSRPHSITLATLLHSAAASADRSTAHIALLACGPASLMATVRREARSRSVLVTASAAAAAAAAASSPSAAAGGAEPAIGGGLVLVAEHKSAQPPIAPAVATPRRVSVNFHLHTEEFTF
jgi:hypothetical protein